MHSWAFQICGKMPITAYSRLFLPILAYSSLFQPSLAYSRLFQHSPVYSNLLKSIPAYSSQFRLFQPIPAYSILCQHIPAYFLIPNLQSPIYNLKCTILLVIPKWAFFLLVLYYHSKTHPNMLKFYHIFHADMLPGDIIPSYHTT